MLGPFGSFCIIINNRRGRSCTNLFGSSIFVPKQKQYKSIVIVSMSYRLFSNFAVHVVSRGICVHISQFHVLTNQQISHPVNYSFSKIKSRHLNYKQFERKRSLKCFNILQQLHQTARGIKKH